MQYMCRGGFYLVCSDAELEAAKVFRKVIRASDFQIIPLFSLQRKLAS